MGKLNGCPGCAHLSQELGEYIARESALIAERGEALTELRAWQSVFGTTQLSRAEEMCESTERILDALQAENARLREEVAWIRRVNHFTMERPLPIIAGFNRTEPKGG